MSEIVKLENVSKVFRRGGILRKESIWAVKNASLTIALGSRIAVVGESGSGKTTLARIITGFEKPSEGYVYWFGKRVDELPKKDFEKLRKKIQYVHQDPYTSLNPVRTVYDTLADPLRKHGVDNVEEKVKELLRLVKITPPEYFFNKFPYHLSGGMRQRLAVARALTASPQLIVADEPISMVDMSLRVSVLDVLLGLNREVGLAVMMISHDIAAAYYFAREGGLLHVMYGGRIIECGPSEKVVSNPFHPYTRLLLLATPQHKRSFFQERISMMARYASAKSGTALGAGGGVDACPYVARCPFAAPECESPIELKEIEAGHYVACKRVDALPEWTPPPWYWFASKRDVA
jgi:peptide/nickel transport system ATP-binding protein